MEEATSPKEERRSWSTGEVDRLENGHPIQPPARQRSLSWRMIMVVCMELALALRIALPAFQLLRERPHELGSHDNADKSGPKGRPNFIFIMTDDQDLHLNSISYQPAVQKHFIDQGTSFNRHYCTISVCCPSRVSLLTGKAAHNTNVTDVKLPYGGYEKFVSEGWNNNYLPIWLQEAGYSTYYTGKLMNGHSIDTYNKPFPRGWNGTNFLVDPNTYIYYNSTTQRDQDTPKYNPGIYSTDIVSDDAVEFLDDAVLADRPFFLGVAPIAPHAETIRLENGGIAFLDPVPAERHMDLFPNIHVPRTPNFNPSVSSGGGFIKTLEQQNDTVVAYNDQFYRARIQSLQAVDDLIENIMSWLHDHSDILENTYIFYTTDNGYHIGQHRLPPGKTCGIEEDINIPFYVRGPGVAKGEAVNFATTHTDIVPTIFELAGILLRDDFDGEPISVTAARMQQLQRRSEYVNVEFWGTGLFEGIYEPDGVDLEPNEGLLKVRGPNNTYKSLRLINEDYNLAYTVWCTNERELYDMQQDPFQMKNLYSSKVTNETMTVSDHRITHLLARLDALLLTLKACKGKVCIRPWEALHPAEDVSTLDDAMDERFDEFYMEKQRHVTFSECSKGYLPELEGALEPLPFPDARHELVR